MSKVHPLFDLHSHYRTACGSRFIDGGAQTVRDFFERLRRARESFRQQAGDLQVVEIAPDIVAEHRVEMAGGTPTPQIMDHLLAGRVPELFGGRLIVTFPHIVGETLPLRVRYILLEREVLTPNCQEEWEDMLPLLVRSGQVRQAPELVTEEQRGIEIPITLPVTLPSILVLMLVK